MYLATCTRPDIAHAMRELTRFMSNYGRNHFAAAKHLLRKYATFKARATGA